MGGYVYVMRSDRFRYFLVHKIGISKYHPKKRRTQIDESMAGGIKIVFYHYCIFPKLVETCAHDFYGMLHLRKTLKRGSGRTEWQYGFSSFSAVLIVLFNLVHVAFISLPIIGIIYLFTQNFNP